MPSLNRRSRHIDNGSIDATARIARQSGAEVVHEPRPGYGRACQAGLTQLRAFPPDIVAFADADGSADLSRFDHLITPLLSGRADFTLARRMPTAPGALSPQQRWGNRLATVLIRVVWGTDEFVNDDGTLKSPAEIEATWAGQGITSDKHLSFYCGTAWRSSLAWFYGYMMGYENIANFDSSWFEWRMGDGSAYAGADPVLNPIEDDEPDLP